MPFAFGPPRPTDAVFEVAFDVPASPFVAPLVFANFGAVVVNPGAESEAPRPDILVESGRPEMTV
ncbi:MAG TPA: hypothetical protein VF483_13765, partial [Gemmatimonadaceae bacterium]